MENRERDKVSQRREPTEAGDINRKTSEDIGRRQSESGVEFGENIRRGENLEANPDMSRNESSPPRGGSKSSGDSSEGRH
jgi:hypothetical protein